jgi:hypothetical protein
MDAIRRKDKENAFSKHLAIYHQEREGAVLSFRFMVEEVHSQPLSRLCSESVRIHKDTCEIPMNSKAPASGGQGGGDQGVGGVRCARG